MNLSFSREIPLNDSYEVIVAGGGPAGCAAAAASASTGAKTLLIEASGVLGGMGTSGMVPAWCPFSDKEKIIYRGIAQKVFEATKAAMPHIDKDALDWVPIDAEALKRIYDDLVTEAGADVLFHTMISAVDFSDGQLNYVVVSNKSGLTAYKSPMFVDCTGDGDLVAWSGLPFEFGSEDTHEVQPATHCFQITNVDEYAYATGPRMHSSIPDCPVYDIVRDEKYPLVKDGHSCNSLVGPRTLGFNAGHLWDVDATDPFSVSKALMQGRKLAHQFHEGLKEYYPSAFAASFLSATAPVMGIRESRRVVGEYTITLEDFLARRTFEDEIGRNSYYIDVHQSESEREKGNSGEFNSDMRVEHYGPGESHGIPYRSLVPLGAGNLLTAGRNVSCDHLVLGSVRVMPTALVTGQAAGTAAAMIALEGLNTHTLDVQKLRAKLREDGAYFL